MTPDLKLISGTARDVASPPEFTSAMSALASGVVIVTCRLDGRQWGMTVTAFSSVSVDPPTVLVSLNSATVGARAIAETREFGVSILAAEQLGVARYGSAPGTPKFLERFTDTTGGSPAVADALAHLDCELSEAVEIADHTVFFGRVRTARTTDTGSPLVYHRRDYRMLSDSAASAPTTERSTICLTN